MAKKVKFVVIEEFKNDEKERKEKIKQLFLNIITKSEM